MAPIIGLPAVPGGSPSSDEKISWVSIFVPVEILYPQQL